MESRRRKKTKVDSKKTIHHNYHNNHISLLYQRMNEKTPRDQVTQGPKPTQEQGFELRTFINEKYSRISLKKFLLQTYTKDQND